MTLTPEKVAELRKLPSRLRYQPHPVDAVKVDRRYLNDTINALPDLLEAVQELDALRKTIADYRDGLEDGDWNHDALVAVRGIIHDLSIFLDRSNEVTDDR